VADNDFLNFKAENVQGWGYCVFGRSAKAWTWNKIKGVKTGTSGFHQDVPKEDVVIQRAEVV
jgi:peptidyl-prolyl cis-trans isomerase B (cyclophilin B)